MIVRKSAASIKCHFECVFSHGRIAQSQPMPSQWINQFRKNFAYLIEQRFSLAFFEVKFNVVNLSPLPTSRRVRTFPLTHRPQWHSCDVFIYFNCDNFVCTHTLHTHSIHYDYLFVTRVKTGGERARARLYTHMYLLP